MSPENGVVNSGMIPSLLQLMKDENKNGYSEPLLWARVHYLELLDFDLVLVVWHDFA